MILLDTCAAIWAATDDASLAKRSRDAIAEAARRGQLYLSAISAWEIATLVRRGRLGLQTSPSAFIDRLFSGPGIREYPVDSNVAATAGSLPKDFHGDPADRLIVATAVVCGFRLFTRDERILRYAGRTRAFAAEPC